MAQKIAEFKKGDIIGAGHLNEMVRRLNALLHFTGDGNVLVNEMGGGVQVGLADSVVSFRRPSRVLYCGLWQANQAWEEPGEAWLNLYPDLNSVTPLTDGVIPILRAGEVTGLSIIATGFSSEANLAMDFQIKNAATAAAGVVLPGLAVGGGGSVNYTSITVNPGSGVPVLVYHGVTLQARRNLAGGPTTKQVYVWAAIEVTLS